MGLACYIAAVVLTIVLATLALLSWVLTLWQWLVAFRFPLHDGASEPAYAPPVSLLKPLKGVDSETAECLERKRRPNAMGRR